MKIRSGFVSNSSSSSYLVRFHVPFDEFARMLRSEYGGNWCTWPIISGKVNARIGQVKKGLADEKDRLSGQPITNDMLSYYDEQLKKLNSFREELDRLACGDDAAVLVKFILKYNQIICDIENDIVKLGNFTSMHNDFVSGMSELLQEIIWFFMFDTDVKVECTREAD